MIKIISDSTCDLSKELLEQFDIDIIPLHVMLGEKEYLDGIDITPDEIYTWADANKTTPKTAAPDVAYVENTFKKYLDDGKELICFTISEQMSTTANVMRLVAKDLEAEERVHVIDSANLSTGVGLLVLEAAMLAANDKTAKEIVDAIEAVKPRVRASFVVDTLTYLHRGGRCSGIASMAGGILKLHPKIEVTDGAMHAGKKYRGKMDKVLMEYAVDMEEQLKNAKDDYVFITHSGCDAATVQKIYDYLDGLNYFKHICITRAGSVISSHCGYGTLGVLFIQ